jgi:anti-sigma factor RsiW
VEHLSEDLLESYLFRRLPPAEVERLDKHLVVCPNCRDRLEAVKTYVDAMRAAAAKIRPDKA